MNISAKDLAERLSLKLTGDTSVMLTDVAGIDEAKEGQLTFIRSERYEKKLSETNASCVIVPENVECPEMAGRAYLVAENPYITFAGVLQLFFVPKFEPLGVSENTSIAEDVVIGENPSIEPFVSVGRGTKIGKNCRIQAHVRIGNNVTIGDEVEIHSNVSIADNCVVGDRVRIHPNVAIGSEGFGFTQTEGGNIKFPQIGNVVIGNDVEIGAGTMIDKASMGSTVIGDGTKMDNLVQIGHGANIGRHNVLCAQSGVAGSVVTGDRVLVGPKTGIADHVKVGSQVMIGSMSGVTKDIPDGVTVSGFPAIPHKDWLKLQSVLHQMPAMREQIKNFLK